MTAGKRRAPSARFALPGDRRQRNQPRLRPQHIADLFEPGAEGIVQQVGIALRGLNLCMAQKLADHRQRHPARNEQRRERMAQIVDTDGGQIGLRPVLQRSDCKVIKISAHTAAYRRPG